MRRLPTSSVPWPRIRNRRGEYVEAERLYTQSLAMFEKTLGAKSPRVAQVLGHLATLNSTQGRFAQAEPFRKRSLAIFEAIAESRQPLSCTETSLTWRSSTGNRGKPRRPSPSTRRPWPFLKGSWGRTIRRWPSFCSLTPAFSRRWIVTPRRRLAVPCPGDPGQAGQPDPDSRSRSRTNLIPRNNRLPTRGQAAQVR